MAFKKFISEGKKEYFLKTNAYPFMKHFINRSSLSSSGPLLRPRALLAAGSTHGKKLR
jgi:hypothetical protein